MGDISSWELRRHDARISDNADQTEFNALAYGKSNLDAGTFDDRIAGALEDYEISVPIFIATWAGTDVAIDSAVSDIGVELKRRANVLGDCYPFQCHGNKLSYKSSTTLVYEFCLAISQAQSLSQGDFKKLPVAFERLMRDLTISFLGNDTMGLRTGWPAEGDRTTNFKGVIEKLSEMTDEWHWSPDHGLPDDPSHQQVKDEGLDFVVWKDFGDGRSGKLFVLGQCACGNDWETKLHDIDADFVKLGKWVKPISYAKPYRMFCIPRHIPNIAYFKQVNKEAGLTFDRTRITLLADKARNSFQEASTRKNYASLIQIVVSGFQVV